MACKLVFGTGMDVMHLVVERLILLYLSDLRFLSLKFVDFSVYFSIILSSPCVLAFLTAKSPFLLISVST